MRNLFYIFLVFVMSLSTSCSNEDDNNISEDLLPLKEYKITVNGVIDGDYTNYPNPTNNSFVATYIKDDNEEVITYTEALLNEMVLEKTKTISARNKVGIKLNINQSLTVLYYINIKIEDTLTGTIIYDSPINKGLVSSNPDAYSTTEIKVLYDVESNSTTLSL